MCYSEELTWFPSNIEKDMCGWENKGTLFCPSSTALKDKRDFENSKEIERQLFVDDVINWQAPTDLEYREKKKKKKALLFEAEFK